MSASILAGSVYLRCFFKDFLIEQPFSPAYGSFIICFLELLSSAVFGDNYFLLLVKYFIDIIKNLCDEPVWMFVVFLKNFP